MPVKSKKSSRKVAVQQQQKATHAFFMLDAEQKLTFFDDTLSAFLSPSSNPVLGKRMSELLGKNNAGVFEVAFADVQGSKTAAEFYMQAGKGQTAQKSVMVNLSPYIRNGKPYGAVGIVRWAFDQKTETSENKFEYLAESLTVGVLIVVDGKNFWLNHAFADIFGYSREEMIGKGMDLIILPEDLPTLMTRMKKRLADLDVPDEYETLGKRKDGSTVFVNVKAKKINYDTKDAILLLIDDITARKRTEEALIKSEKLHRTLAETARDVICIFNRDLSLEYVNNYTAGFFKCCPNDMIGRDWDQFVGQQKSSKLKEKIDLIFKTGESIYLESEIQTPKGDYWMGAWLVPILDEEDSVKNVLMVGRNISERKKMEQALRESEEKYKNLFQCLQEAVFILYEGKIIQCNPAATRIFGCKQNQLVGKTVCDISPPRQPNDRLSRDLANKLLRKVMDGKEQFFEWEHLRCDGTVFLTEVNLARYILQDKKFVFGIVRDISEKHLAEQQLKISEARYRDIVERSLDGYYFLNCEGIATIVNSSVLEITGLQREQVMNANFADFVPEDKKEYVLKLLTSVMGGTPYSWEEIELIRSDGKKIWIAFNGRRVIQNGIVIGVEGFVRDITELKKTENKIRESEARYKALFDSIPYEVFGLDAEGVFHEANQEFIQNWGNVVERLPNSIKNKELRTIITESLENVSKTLKSAKRNFEIKKNDLTKHFTLILCPIITKEEGLIGFVGINMDISELIFALREAKLMSARLLDIQEEERTRIASEIHDSLGQYMTALQLEISTANASLRSNPDLAEKVMSDAKQTITRAIIEAKDLCHVLRPHLLDDFGLVVAIKDYAKEYSQKWKIKIDFHADDVKGLLSQTSETALYRFVQEALTNILKHSRATHAEIRLTRTDNVIELKICDDGVGFNKDIVYYSKRDRFGLIFMKERIEFLGGRFILDSTLEKGTTLKAILPIDE